MGERNNAFAERRQQVIGRRHERLLALARAGDTAGVAELLAGGLPPDPEQDSVETALHVCAYEGHTDTLRALLDGGADPLRLDSRGSTSLHRAALAGRAPCVAVLLDHGIDLNLRDRGYRTALQEAVQGACLQTARLLIDQGADLNATDQFGRTALSKVYDKIEDAAVAEAMEGALLEAGASPYREDGRFLCVTPLMHALLHGDRAAARRCLREDPGCIDINHFRLGTALHIAAREGDVRTVRWLLDSGADPGRVSEGGVPLQCAAAHGHAAVARVLLAAAPKTVAASGGYDPPALKLAARSGDARTVDLLLEAGADPRATTINGRTARDCAANAAVRERLRRAMLAGNPSPRRRQLDNATALARLLISEGEESPRLPPTGGEDGIRPLHCAVAAASAEVIEHLLEGGAELLDYKIPAGWHGVNSLAEARREARERRMAKHLGTHARLVDFAAGLGGGMCDIDWRNTSEPDILAWFKMNPNRANAHYVDALSPLHMAAAFDMPDAVSLLIDLDARLETTTHMGETPLTFAARRAGRETVERLVQAGADFGNRSGPKPPLHEACRAGNAVATKALIDAGADVNAAAFLWSTGRR